MGGDGVGAVSTRIWTIPNVLSMLRLALVPPFLVLIVLGDYVAALIILIVASLTDLLDGYLARPASASSSIPLPTACTSSRPSSGSPPTSSCRGGSWS